MRADGWPGWLLAGLALALVALGLAVVGGPGAGRAERRDGLRLGDLQAIQGALACARMAGVEAPADLAGLEAAEGAGCPAPTRTADPFTGEPYGYERLSPDRVRLCAAFERADLVAWPGYGTDAFDPATGCLAATLPEPPEPA